MSTSTPVRVLFLYPNQRSMSLVPPSIALFTAILRQRGFEVDLFDTSTYLIEGIDSDEVFAKHLTFREVKDDEKKIKREKKDAFADLDRRIRDFKPNLLAVTTTDCTSSLALRLLASVRHHQVLTVAGGAFPTFAPERMLSHPEIDIVCVGEGEEALVELCEAIRDGKDYRHIKNLWTRKAGGGITANAMRPPTNLDRLPPLDLGIFEDKRLYRMMAGKVYRMMPVETHRGCPYQCTYCGSPTNNRIYRTQTHCNFMRKKALDKVHEELLAMVSTFKAEYIFFWADTFFMYTAKEIDAFCDMYRDIGLPFYAQARPETITEYKLNRLKEVGLHRVGVGIEHGNETYRSEVLGRHYSNRQVVESLNVVYEAGIPFSVNNIIGLPDETPELVMDTVELNRQVKSSDSSCSVFQPYHGTRLRQVCVEKGYISDDDIPPPNSDNSILSMPGFSKERIAGLARTFNMYVRFPKDRWPEINVAERLTPEGDAMWAALRKEFVETYFA